MIDKAVKKGEYVPEMLGSVFLKGTLHAAYPTARRTLCSLPCSPRGEMMTDKPNCAGCLDVIRRWQVARIQGIGLPKEWRMERKHKSEGPPA